MKRLTLKTVKRIFELQNNSKGEFKELGHLLRYNLLQKTDAHSDDCVHMSREGRYKNLEELFIDFYRKYAYGAQMIIDGLDNEGFSRLIYCLKYYKIEYMEFENEDYMVGVDLNTLVTELYKGYCNGDDVIIDSFESAVKADELLSNMDVSILCDELDIKCYENITLNHTKGEDKILATANAIVMNTGGLSYNIIYKETSTAKIALFDFFTTLIVRNCKFKPRIIHFYDKTISVRGENDYKVYSIKKIKENLKLWQ